MSAYNPPVENVPIFDASLFRTTNSSTSGFLTKDEANRLYLQYPFGQGTQTLPALNVSGNQTTTGNIVMNGVDTTNYIQFPNGTRQYTASTTATTFKIANYFYYNLVNTSPLPAPYPTIAFGNIVSKNYWDGVIFRVVLTLQNNASSLSGTSGSVSNFDATFSATMTIFPKAFIAGTNIPVYFNNGIGTTTSNTAYAPVSSAMSAYVANGRPYWASGIVNDTNVVASLTPSLTNNGSTATMILNFPAINWGGSLPTLNYSMTFELLNTGRYLSTDITTTGFTTNF
jgi:hypothetical protein